MAFSCPGALENQARSFVSLFGLDFNVETLASATRLIFEDARARRKSLVITPNVDHIVSLTRNDSLRYVYGKADYLFADGMPVVWFSHLLPSVALPERVTGADLLVSLLEATHEAPLSLAIIGGEEWIGEAFAARVSREHPGVLFKGHYSPPFGFEHDEAETEKMVSLVNEWRPDLLVLALGAPKQEIWAAQHIDKLDCGPVLCFGAAVDFYVGKVRRAPVFVQEAGLEWCWRLASEPRRLWRRYLIEDARILPEMTREFYVRWCNHLKDSSRLNK